MTQSDLPTKNISSQDHLEEKSRQILRSKLPNTVEINFGRDKYPNTDGYIEFFSNNGSTTIKFFFQLKSSESNVSYHDCETEYLNYCYLDKSPNFLLFVNIPQQKVYWQHIDRSYIISTLQIEDIKKFDQKTKRISFLEESVVDQDTASLIAACDQHYADLKKIEEDNIIARDEGKTTSGEESAIKLAQKRTGDISQKIESTQTQLKVLEGKGNTKDFNETKNKFSSLIEKLDDKLILYQAFVYVLKPFYLDSRGKEQRKKLLTLLNISEDEENFILSRLLGAGLLNQVGELVFVANKEEAMATFNKFLDDGKINPEEVANLF